MRRLYDVPVVLEAMKGCPLMTYDVVVAAICMITTGSVQTSAHCEVHSEFYFGYE